MSSARILIAAAAILAPMVAILAVHGSVGVELIVTSPACGDAPLLTIPLPRGGCFTLNYIHSVSGRPVWEVHSVDAWGTIYIEEERFAALSAGMGHWPGHGQLSMRGDHVVVDGIHAPLGSFLLRVGQPGVDHTLIWSGGEVNLTEMAAGEVVRVAARRVSWLEGLWRGRGASRGSG